MDYHQKISMDGLMDESMYGRANPFLENRGSLDIKTKFIKKEIWKFEQLQKKKKVFHRKMREI